jgi:hypothetical protein
MRKLFKFSEKSEKKCQGCDTKLKKNLIHKKPDADKCYKCFMSGKMTNQQKRNEEFRKMGKGVKSV